MGRVQLFEICLRQGRVVYSPGEPLAGVVRVRLGAPLPFRGGRGVAPGVRVDAFLPAVGAGLQNLVVSGLGDWVLSIQGTLGYDGTAGARVRLCWEARAGQAAGWPSPSASVPSCA